MPVVNGMGALIEVHDPSAALKPASVSGLEMGEGVFGLWAGHAAVQSSPVQ